MQSVGPKKFFKTWWTVVDQCFIRIIFEAQTLWGREYVRCWNISFWLSQSVWKVKNPACNCHRLQSILQPDNWDHQSFGLETGSTTVQKVILVRGLRLRVARSLHTPRPCYYHDTSCDFFTYKIEHCDIVYNLYTLSPWLLPTRLQVTGDVVIGKIKLVIDNP